MITCSVCGCLNDPSNAVCVECGSDLSDSEDWMGDDFYIDDDDDF
jgi:RNA polymerase subunit RPABC4/transcription elongation factor Spt4